MCTGTQSYFGRMPASYSAAFPPPPEPGAEHLVRFAFPVTWSFLADHSNLRKFSLSSDPQRRSIIPASIISTSIISTSPTSNEPSREPVEAVEFQPAATGIPAEVAAPARPAFRAEDDAVSPFAPLPPLSGDRWEMVIPQMNRPTARARNLISEWPQKPAGVEELAQLERDRSAGTVLRPITEKEPDRGRPIEGRTPVESPTPAASGGFENHVPHFARVARPLTSGNRMVASIRDSPMAAALSARIRTLTEWGWKS